VAVNPKNVILRLVLILWLGSESIELSFYNGLYVVKAQHAL
jgi:hypothetical protein